MSSPRLFRSAAIVLAVCTAALVAPVQAGPPLLCHQIQIGDAKSLPWGKDTFTQAADYSKARVADDALELLTPEMPVLVRMETLRRATLYLQSDVGQAERLFGALLSRTLDSEVVMDPKVAALRYFDAGYLASTLQQGGVAVRFGPAAEGTTLHSEVPGYAWAVRGYKIAGGEDRDMAIGLALMTADTRLSEQNMFLEQAVKATKVDDTARCDLLQWIAQIRGSSLEALRAKFVTANAPSQR